MKMIVVLSALLLGQASGWQGYASPDGLTYVIKQYKVNFEGRDLVVEGWYNPERRTVVWSPERDFNRRALAVARSAGARRAPVAGDIRNFGLDPDHMGKRPIVQASPEAARFIAESHTSAGHVKLHLTVIGSDDARAPVVNDLLTHPAFAALKDHLYIQGYKPDEWPVDPSLGFQTNGTPSIILQTARGPADPKGGRVVYRANDYAMGPQGLAQTVSEAVRKADPSYRPTVDPGPATGNGGLPFGLTTDEALAYGLALGVVVLAAKLPRKEG